MEKHNLSEVVGAYMWGTKKAVKEKAIYCYECINLEPHVSWNDFKEEDLIRKSDLKSEEECYKCKRKLHEILPG